MLFIFQYLGKVFAKTRLDLSLNCLQYLGKSEAHCPYKIVFIKRKKCIRYIYWQQNKKYWLGLNPCKKKRGSKEDIIKTRASWCNDCTTCSAWLLLVLISGKMSIFYDCCRRTDGLTDQRMVRLSFRDVRMHLVSVVSLLLNLHGQKYKFFIIFSFTNWRTNGRTDPPIEMRGRIWKWQDKRMHGHMEMNYRTSSPLELLPYVKLPKNTSKL